MSRLGDVTLDPKDTASLAEVLTQLLRTVDSKIEFGMPNHPQDPTSVVLAGSGTPTTHNGILMNITGSWVEVEFEATDTPVTCSHNLNVPIFGTEVNVRWIVMGIRHSGVGATGASTLSVNFEDGDSITVNSIQLRAYSSSGRTVDADNPIRVSLFFIRANRWPN